ncbi:MAG TPA: extracellular solute-binding protein, partial [Bacillota bacterium]|nr:extracellular solute-binding protein [Bacillota bacterium]
MGNKKWLLILVGLALVIITACSKDEEGKPLGEASDKDKEVLNEDDEVPIVNEEITLDIFAGQAPATNPDWNDVLIWNEYEKMTNIDVNWEMVPYESREEKRNLALGGGELPDVFHGAGIPVSDQAKYGKEGVFIPLNDLIDEYAPNFKSIMEQYPEVEKSITMPDGNIYALPLIGDPEFASYLIGPKPFINKEWLDTLDMDMPETTDDYYNYLKAAKDHDPGDNDGVPFGGPDISQLYAYLRGSFGLANKGSSGGLLDVDPETDDYRFYPIADEYKELMEYMHKLYEEGLIEKNIFSIDHNQYLANASEGKYGSVVWYSPRTIMGKEVGDDYEGMPALEGPHGDKMWTVKYDTVLTPGAFAITKENEYPATTLRWADYFYGDEGMKMYFMGIEGETYEEDENGNPVYMDHILNSEEGLTYEEELAKYLTFPGGGFPSMTTEKYFKGAESSPESLEAAEKLEKDMPEDPWITPVHTKEENDELRGFGSDIEKYVTEMRDKFISGDEPLSNWDKYVKEIEKMNLDRYMEIKI